MEGNLTGGPVVVTIQASDQVFQSTGCGTWTNDLSRVTTDTSGLAGGTYIVGTDIQPGTYTSSGGGYCYWFRLSGFGDQSRFLIQSGGQGNEGPSTVTVEPSDKGFQSQDCGRWTLASEAAAASSPTSGAPEPSFTPESSLTAEPSPTPRKSFPAALSFGDGSYRVGVDISPGVYRTVQGIQGDWLYGCTWEVDAAGGSVRAAGAGGWGQIVVTIEPDAVSFQTSGCGFWTNSLPSAAKAATRFDDGTYIVGIDIKPGTYTSDGGYSCFWARLSGFGNTPRYAIQSGDGSNTTVTILSTDQGFQTHECGTWTRK
jgi:hypothetical protein